MKILILGGTEFVGRSVAEAALGRGWDVSVFNRGRQKPVPGTLALHGDRTAGKAGLAALESGTWDAVVDTWTGAPAAVRDAARLLADRTGHYTYVSTRSVHPYPAAAGLPEGGPLVSGASADEAGEVPYPQAKLGGEMAALDAFGDRTLLARPGLILGPYENIGRLPWWLNRIARGGPVLAPGPHDSPLQYIDARDLATWVLDAAGQGLHGPYNTVSESGHATLGELLDACVRVTGSGAELRWTDPDTILAAGVAPWTELPIWLPAGEMHDTLHRGDVSKALAAGLRCRPIGETVADTWTWLTARGGVAPQRPDRPPVGLAPDVEARLLAAG
ncbi:NAD-dependent epimerase/dehydratase family protein [Streptomyces sp. NPDC008125]|uniref:NAD-dependent epimerase/dehydratase family protein n=1 Tax=Streptomyces sp. NPDC008125 TaxID=3364811 RepID=UPI0036F1010A